MTVFNEHYARRDTFYPNVHAGGVYIPHTRDNDVGSSSASCVRVFVIPPVAA